MELKMTAIVFDTLEYMKKAKEAGFSQSQAEFQAHELAKWFNMELATKQDLKYLRKDIIDTMTIRIGGMLFAAMTLIISVLGFLILFKK